MIVGRNELRITVATAHMAAELRDSDSRAGGPNDELSPLDDHEAVLPVHLKRCGIETRLVVPNEDESDSPAHPNTAQAIQQALAKALKWNQALLDGSVQSMTELATQN